MLVIDEATQGKNVTTKITGNGATGIEKKLDNDGIIIYHIHANDNKITITCEEKTRILDLTELTLKSDGN